jgi:hypothetical protein
LFFHEQDEGAGHSGGVEGAGAAQKHLPQQPPLEPPHAALRHNQRFLECYLILVFSRRRSSGFSLPPPITSLLGGVGFSHRAFALAPNNSISMPSRPTTAAAGLQRLSRLLFQTPHIINSSTSTTIPWRPAAARAFAAGGGAAAPRPPPPPLPPRPPTTLSPFDRWRAALRAAPSPALALGALGVLPFIALATPVAKQIAPLLPLVVAERAETFQIGYGVAIASFLGGVHWGAVCASPLTATATAGSVAARMAAERLTWGVVPSLLAWPLVAMEPGPAAALLSALLPALYAADRRFARRGLLPSWYLALRAPLTLGATFGCLLTATYHAHSEADRAAARAEAAANKARAAAAATGGTAAAPSPSK